MFILATYKKKTMEKNAPKKANPTRSPSPDPLVSATVNPEKSKSKNKTSIKSQASSIDETNDWKQLYEDLVKKFDKLSGQMDTLLLQTEKKDNLIQELLEKVIIIK